MTPLVSKERFLYLKFIDKLTNEDLATDPLVHLTSPHTWNPTMLDAPNPYHSLITDGGEYGSPNGPSEGSKLKILSTPVPHGSFRSRCDQDPSAVKPMSEFDRYEKLLFPTLEN